MTSKLGLLLTVLLLLGCGTPKGSWEVTVESSGYYEIWAGGEVVKTVSGPRTFYLVGPPHGSDDQPWYNCGLPGQSPGDGKGYGFKHTDGHSFIVAPFFCSQCVKTQ